MLQLSKSQRFDVHATTLEPEIPPDISPEPSSSAPVDGWLVSTLVLDTPVDSDMAPTEIRAVDVL